jgi:hypothetical protein
MGSLGGEVSTATTIPSSETKIPPRTLILYVNSKECFENEKNADDGPIIYDGHGEYLGGSGNYRDGGTM